MLGFLLVKIDIPLREKLRNVSLWDLFVPALLVLFATVFEPRSSIEEAVSDNSLRLTFLAVFFVGVGTAFV